MLFMTIYCLWQDKFCIFLLKKIDNVRLAIEEGCPLYCHLSCTLSNETLKLWICHCWNYAGKGIHSPTNFLLHVCIYSIISYKRNIFGKFNSENNRTFVCLMQRLTRVVLRVRLNKYRMILLGLSFRRYCRNNTWEH